MRAVMCERCDSYCEIDDIGGAGWCYECNDEPDVALENSWYYKEKIND